jgi:uncharacterized protein
MSGPPRVVLDTNVVLSALVFGHGRLAPLRQAWQTGRCVPLASHTTAAELLRAIAYPKFKLTAADQEELLAEYLPFCESVRIPTKPPKTPICRDPFEVPFLELAIAGNAAFLVTGDRDLLALKPNLPFAIVTGQALIAESSGCQS